MKPHLLIENLSKSFTSSRGDVQAIEDLSLDISQSEFVALIGPSGCGKSTLLRIVAGLLPADGGNIHFSGWPHTPKCRLVFQDHTLLPWLTVIDNVAFGLETAGISLVSRRARALSQLTNMGISEFAEHYPHELSGGMRQRAAIARAFLAEPDILLMDEPLRALDAQMRLVIQEELLDIWQTHRPMVLYVTHDIEEALLLADRVLVMSGKPARICKEFVVPLDRPRDLTGCSHPGFNEIKREIWKMLEFNVRNHLKAKKAGLL